MRDALCGRNDPGRSLATTATRRLRRWAFPLPLPTYLLCTSYRTEVLFNAADPTCHWTRKASARFTQGPNFENGSELRRRCPRSIHILRTVYMRFLLSLGHQHRYSEAASAAHIIASLVRSIEHPHMVIAVAGPRRSWTQRSFSDSTSALWYMPPTCYHRPIEIASPPHPNASL